MTEPVIQAPAATPAPIVIATPPAPPPEAVATLAPPVAPVAVTTPTVAAGEPAEGAEPAWAKARLERAREAARKDMLRELGVDDPKDAKTSLEAYRVYVESQKSDLQKATERAAQLDPLTKERDSYRDRLEAHTAIVLASLTPEQRSAVERIAGKDPVKVSDAIEVLRPTWSTPAAIVPTPAAAPIVAAPPPLAAGASTAPAGAPPPPTTPPTENKLAVYEDLQKKNPMRAAGYLLSNYAAIEAAKKTRA